MPNEIVVLVTCPAAHSNMLASTLVEERLCACVNIVPSITSVYIWEKKLSREPEELLIVKTNLSQWEALKARIRELHSYTLPEIICLPILNGYKPYLDWINATVGSNDAGEQVTSD